MFVSVITEIELLSYPLLSNDENDRIRAFLDDIAIAGINNEIVTATISLRRKFRLRLPDAVIAGTALALNAVLLPNDSRLKVIEDIDVRALSLR